MECDRRESVKVLFKNRLNIKDETEIDRPNV